MATVVLFGYDSSPFTNKIRLVLRLKQIPYTFIVVPSMMPRSILRESFHLTYRKIPVLAIGCDVYIDTSIIIEALEHRFTLNDGYPSIYPLAADGRNYRPIMRGFASYWTDRPLFRVATGLIPGSVWRTDFGTDRAGLIGHKLDPSKLEAKRPFNLAALDLQLSLLEPQLEKGKWIFSTAGPSLADISLYYQLDWACDISSGKGIDNLTGGRTRDTDEDVISEVFNALRYPNTCAWFHAFRLHVSEQRSTERRKTKDFRLVVEELKLWKSSAPLLIETPRPVLQDLMNRTGLKIGQQVSVAPDDTGRNDPTLGELIALSPEEIVIKPKQLADIGAPLIDVLLHFPWLGFVCRPVIPTGKL